MDWRFVIGTIWAALKDDEEVQRVWFGAVVSSGTAALVFNIVTAVLTLIVLVGTAVFTWLKVVYVWRRLKNEIPKSNIQHPEKFQDPNSKTQGGALDDGDVD